MCEDTFFLWPNASSVCISLCQLGMIHGWNCHRSPPLARLVTPRQRQDLETIEETSSDAVGNVMKVTLTTLFDIEKEQLASVRKIIESALTSLFCEFWLFPNIRPLMLNTPNKGPVQHPNISRSNSSNTKPRFLGGRDHQLLSMVPKLRSCWCQPWRI